MAKKNPFDTFLEKNFETVSPEQKKIVRPVGGERETSFEQRRQAASQHEEQPEVKPAAVESKEDVVVAVEEPRRPGRPKREGRGEVVNMNFLIEKEVKVKLEQLKLDLFRSSVTDLMMEAIRDLFIKYGVNEKAE